MPIDPAYPTPGGPAAVVLGCTCPTWDNNENIRLIPGRGLVYTINDDCPMHGTGTDYYESHAEDVLHE